MNKNIKVPSDGAINDTVKRGGSFPGQKRFELHYRGSGQGICFHQSRLVYAVTVKFYCEGEGDFKSLGTANLKPACLTHFLHSSKVSW